MSQRNRIVLAAVALVAALSLAAPSPSHAAGLQPWRIPAVDLWERAWNWMAGLLPGGASQKPTISQEKEGSAINPNGSLAPLPPGTQSDEGGAVNPEGVK